MNGELVKRLTDERARLWEEQKRLLDDATARGMDRLTGGDEQAYQQRNSRMDEIDDRLKELRQDDERQRQAAAAFDELRSSPQVAGHHGRASSAELELQRQFRAAILENDRRPITVTWEAPRSGFQPGIERRDLLTTSGGGMHPTSFYNRIITHLTDNSAILAAGATMITTTSGEPLMVPKSTARSAATIVDEAAVIPESDPTLGRVQLGAWKYGFLVEVSNELVTDATWDVAGYLAEQAGLALANGAGADFMAGAGTTEPAGLVGATTAGVTGADTTDGTFTADELIDLAHSLAEPYARSRSAAWIMRQATLGAVRRLKAAGDGQYLFDVNVVPGSGAAGTLLGRPVYCDPSVPAVAAGAKSVLFGDISRYWVRHVNGIRFERSEDYAFNRDVTVFRALWRADGALIDTSGSVKAFQGGTV